jgi:hypothetical protein
MKKSQIVLLALLVVSAFSAVFAVTASAEITLLAEWLLSGVGIAAGVEQATETAGSILLEDTGAPGAAAVLCTAILDGFLLANGLDLVTKILNLALEEIGELGGLALVGITDCVSVKTCENASDIEVWPHLLPWHTLLFLAEDGKFLDSVSKEDGTQFGYELLCLVLGINVEDLCWTTRSAFEVLNDADTGDASVPAGAEGLPFAECNLGGLGTGRNVADELTPITIPGSELLLTVSSE